MADQEMVCDAIFNDSVNSRVIALSPAVSIGSNMLALAGSMARDFSNATNQQQLNYTMGMVAAMQTCGGGRSSSDSRAADEAMGLLKQVIAAVQAN